MDADAKRGRVLLEESRESVVVLDEADRVIGASRRARQSIDGLREGAPIPEGLLSGEAGIVPLVVPYDIDGRRERLVYLSRGGDLTAYEELRTGFTAAVSHELRTPLARLLSLLEMATLPGEDVAELVDQARSEVGQIRELIDEVLFLSELESGSRVVSLGAVAVRPELEAVAAELEDRASRAGVALAVEGDPGIELEIRPRMLRVVAQNLAENAIRYAGPGATFTLAIERDGDTVILRGTDDGVGVDETDLSRLFERFYRADRARASRGTGLGLAIVKHIVTQAGGTIEAHGGLGAGLEVRCCVRARRRAPVRLTRRSSLTSSSPVVHQAAAHAGVTPRDTPRRVSVTTPHIDSARIAEVAQPVAQDGRGRETVFDVEGLAVSYSGNVALDDVTLDIRKNFVTAFIGPSGLRQVDVHPLLQPDERPDPRRPRRRAGALPRP